MAVPIQSLAEVHVGNIEKWTEGSQYSWLKRDAQRLVDYTIVELNHFCLYYAS